jgi:hypothetical protein
MTEKELEDAVVVMKAIVMMARSPLVTRRGNAMIEEFKKSNSPKPKKKTEE